MVSLEKSNGLEPTSSPRISFSSEFLDDESNFISICPNDPHESEITKSRAAPHNAEFEFLSSSSRNNNSTNKISTADELFSEGKLLPFSYHMQKLNKINLEYSKNIPKRGPQPPEEIIERSHEKEEGRISWFVDDDPSPRPPKCTVLWKELLIRLKKQHSPALSPSSRTSPADERNYKDKYSVKRIKNLGQEKKRSIGVRIRPVLKERVD